MNRCPQCQSEFADHILYCVNDGQRLEPADAATLLSPAAKGPRRLAELLDAETPMAVAHAARIALALCDAVAEQRRTGGVNEPLDPQAISIDEPDGGEPPRIKIETRGAAAAEVGEHCTSYLAPEPVPQNEISAAADVYSIGAITYKMLTGEPPFAAATPAALRIKQLLEQPRPLVNLRPDIPPHLEAVILRALDKEPSTRPASVAQLRREIETALAGLNTPPVAQEKTGALSQPPPVAQQAPGALGQPPGAMLPPAPAMMSAPPPAPMMSASPSPTIAAPMARAGSIKRKAIAVALALLALLLSAAAFVIYIIQSREASPRPPSLTSSASEPANANTAEPQSASGPANQNTSTTANRNGPGDGRKDTKKPQPAASPPVARPRPAVKNEPPATPAPDAKTKPPARPAPDARMAPPIGDVHTLAPAPEPASRPVPANQNKAAATKPQPKTRPKERPRPAQPAASTPPPAQPASPVEPIPVTAANEAVRARSVNYGRWIVPALLLCLALTVAALAGLLWRNYQLKRRAAQIAAPPAVIETPAEAQRVEARAAPTAPVDAQTKAPIIETQAGLLTSATTIIADTPPVGELFHRCPACQTEYSTSVRFCVHDGTTLATASKIVPPKAEPSFYDFQTLESRKRCPQCGTEYPLTKKFCRYDGEGLVELKPPARPTNEALQMSPIVIGQYRCFARLGEGGMGIVYKAQHIHLKRLSAIKVLLPQTVMIPDAVQMFRHEAQLASSINHPNSVIIYDYGELDARLFYLAMEFIAGASLAEVIAPDGEARALPLARALDITQQVCDALDAAHLLGIIHRDLKPHNVMITMRPSGGDFVKVVDFGIARSLKLAADYAALPGAIAGTPAYMSPEQARGVADLDARSDLYSLGVMVYQMLSGALPFPATGVSTWQAIDQRAKLRELPPSLNALRPDLNIPREVNDAVMRALDPDRDRRFPSASDFMHDLSHAARPAY